MHVAKRLGIYDDRKILLIDFASSVEVMRAYRNGVVDVAALTADEALTIVGAEPGKHRIIAVTAYSKGGDGIVAQPTYTQFSKLKGRRVGVEANALGGYVLSRALQKHGLSLNDIELVPVSLDQQLTAFEAGTVEALVTFEPNRSRLLASGAVEVFDSNEMTGEIMDVLVTRAVLLADRRPVLQYFLRGWFSGLKHLQTDAAAAAMAALHERVGPDTFTASLQGFELLDRDRNLKLFDTRQPALRIAFQTLTDRMRETGIVTAALDPHALYGPLLAE